MSIHPPRHLGFVIDELRDRIADLEQELAALQADIAAHEAEGGKR